MKTPAPDSAANALHPALEHIALVVFDLDGTLIDSVPDLAAAIDTTLTERSLEAPGIERVRDWVGNGSHKLVERALAHAQDISEEAVDRETVDAAHARFLEHYVAAPCARTRPYDGVRQCLSNLATRGVTCVLVTNKPIAFVGPILEHFELERFFALTLGGDSLNEKKPHPAPLLYSAQQMDIDPARALMIGDSRHDIEAGKAAGFRTLAVSYGYNHGEPVSASEPDYIIDTLAELR
ncbi:phosphoglycolate phosphatase [Salinisphaera shabanensis]|uniref:phosphoglycolate phosphatase n=1 Tax=Salinisphaera shabanensis TaxID=180542 RepID=UPI00334049EC